VDWEKIRWDIQLSPLSQNPLFQIPNYGNLPIEWIVIAYSHLQRRQREQANVAAWAIAQLGADLVTYSRRSC